MAANVEAEAQPPGAPASPVPTLSPPAQASAEPSSAVPETPSEIDDAGGEVADEEDRRASDDTRRIETERLDELTTAIERMTSRLAADQDVIGRMQSRIEALQGDQVRALLGPAVTELANLHAAIAEAAGRDYERLGLDRVRKEFDLLGDRVESAIDVLGAVSIDARVGDTFDSRSHQAVKHVPTADPALDKTVAAVLRQGFTFDPDARPALHARVQVFGHDGGTDTPGPVSADDDLDVPFPL